MEETRDRWHLAWLYIDADEEADLRHETFRTLHDLHEFMADHGLHPYDDLAIVHGQYLAPGSHADILVPLLHERQREKVAREAEQFAAEERATYERLKAKYEAPR